MEWHLEQIHFGQSKLSENILERWWRLRRPVWSDLAKFCKFGKNLKAFGYSLRVYFAFCKILNLLWQLMDTFSLLKMVKYGTNYLAIWSQWRRQSRCASLDWPRSKKYSVNFWVNSNKKISIINVPSMVLWILFDWDKWVTYLMD